MNNPFGYQPHPLCQEAARLLQQQLPALMTHYPDEGGKMFGVLVVRHGHQMGYLQAYSGQLGGAYPWANEFVPPVFDYLSPQGHFKQTEQRISALNHQMEAMHHEPWYRLRLEHQRTIQNAASHHMERWRSLMAKAKQQRDAMREGADEAMRKRLVAESQFQKAQLKRLRSRWACVTEAIGHRAERHGQELERMGQERHRMSDQLQRWLFDHFVMRNARGEEQSLSDIFAHYDANRPYLVPPGGTGECCEPKLLQYAYLHGMRPLCMAMFWWGQSRGGEVRHHLHFYPACQGKCRPTLAWMLQGLEVEEEERGRTAVAREAVERTPEITSAQLEVVYEDEWLVVVNKPAGMLSVPGRNALPSVASLMRQRHPEATGPMVVHRLDMDTSGLMLIALNTEVHKQLQRQFAERLIQKTYVALLESSAAPMIGQGEISLPLSADADDRPRQRVDLAGGKPALTRYRFLTPNRVLLHPLTGRTHQLRIHCAHPDGLGRPILGDPLYGHSGKRLCLHAQEICFVHPITHQQMTLSRPAPF